MIRNMISYMKSLGRIALFLLGVVTWATLSAPTAWAAGVVGTGSPASCESNDLADALTDGGLVIFNCGSAPYTINSATYVINDDTTILGGNRITLDGEDLRQHFLVAANATLVLEEIILLDGESSQGGCIAVDKDAMLITRGVTFEGCRDVSQTIGGGAIYNLGLFDATDTLFKSNRAELEGGAVFNRGAFTATRVLFEANTAGDDSGAIENDTNGIVIVQDSAFVGNSAANAGGAVGNTLSFPTTTGSFTIRRTLFVDNSSTTIGGAVNNVTGGISIANSAFVRNTSEEGGAVYASGGTNTKITFSTFDDNRATLGASIYRPLTGVIELGHSILTGGRNKSDTQDVIECEGPSVTSLGYNLIEDGSCVNGNNDTDIRNTPPQIGALTNNGGFSQSMMPDADSPALGKIPAAQCLPLDQRGASRSGACDIGAVERGGLFTSAFLPRLEKQ